MVETFAAGHPGLRTADQHGAELEDGRVQHVAPEAEAEDQGEQGPVEEQGHDKVVDILEEEPEQEDEHFFFSMFLSVLLSLFFF